MYIKEWDAVAGFANPLPVFVLREKTHMCVYMNIYTYKNSYMHMYLEEWDAIAHFAKPLLVFILRQKTHVCVYMNIYIQKYIYTCVFIRVGRSC